MSSRHKLTALLIGTTLFSSLPALARDCNMGTTIFTDGLYGMAGGTVVGGLWMLANPSDTKGSDIIPNLATAALIGTGVGAILGVVEVGLCTKDIATRSEKPGFQIPKIALMSSRFSSHSETGMGLGFRYVIR